MIVSFCMVTCRSRMQIRCLREAKKIYFQTHTCLLHDFHPLLHTTTIYIWSQWFLKCSEPTIEPRFPKVLGTQQFSLRHFYGQIIKIAQHGGSQGVLKIQPLILMPKWRLGSSGKLVHILQFQRLCINPVSTFFFSYGHTVYHICAHLKTFPLILPYKL